MTATEALQGRQARRRGRGRHRAGEGRPGRPRQADVPRRAAPASPATSNAPTSNSTCCSHPDAPDLDGRHAVPAADPRRDRPGARSSRRAACPSSSRSRPTRSSCTWRRRIRAAREARPPRPRELLAKAEEQRPAVDRHLRRHRVRRPPRPRRPDRRRCSRCSPPTASTTGCRSRAVELDRVPQAGAAARPATGGAAHMIVRDGPDGDGVPAGAVPRLARRGRRRGEARPRAPTGAAARREPYRGAGPARVPRRRRTSKSILEIDELTFEQVSRDASSSTLRRSATTERRGTTPWPDPPRSAARRRRSSTACSTTTPACRPSRRGTARRCSAS